jgi:hypothetical protein
MHNQHRGLSQLLATQRISEQHEQTTHAQLVRGARPPRGRRRQAEVRRWWQLARWPAVAPVQPVRRPQPAADRSEETMSNRARALILGATLAAMNLAGLTAVAQAQPTQDDAVKRAAEAQERYYSTWSYGDPAAERALAQERYYSTWGYGDTPAPATPRPSGQPDWLFLGLGVLAATGALSTGLAVLAAKRARRRTRLGHAA